MGGSLGLRVVAAPVLLRRRILELAAIRFSSLVPGSPRCTLLLPSFRTQLRCSPSQPNQIIA